MAGGEFYLRNKEALILSKKKLFLINNITLRKLLLGP